MGNCMGWSSSGCNMEDTSSQSGGLPTGVTEISRNSLYELYRPNDGEPEMDIIFFHGLQHSTYADAYWKTWTNKENTIWPQTFLGEKFPQCRVLSLCYDSCARQWARGGRLDIYLIGENLVQIIMDDEAADVGNRPVILVGHSLGGLVIKEFLMKTNHKRYGSPLASAGRQKLDKFLDENLTGIFYYATPHGGSELANYVNKLPGNSPLIKFLQVLSSEASRLNNDFSNWRKSEDHKIPIFAIAEGRPTSLRVNSSYLRGIVNTTIVPEASARQDIDRYYTANEDDHITVCKPQTKNDMTFKLLCQFIKAEVSQKRHVTDAIDMRLPNSSDLR